jgi:mono/diheme cytochrome c family protein
MASCGADIFDQSIEQVHFSRMLCRRAWSARVQRRRPIHGASEGDFEERIVAFVRRGFPERFCCRCIAMHFEVPELRVRNAAQVVIARHQGIRVARGRCSACHSTDEVLIVTTAEP